MTPRCFVLMSFTVENTDLLEYIQSKIVSTEIAKFLGSGLLRMWIRFKQTNDLVHFRLQKVTCVQISCIELQQ